MADVESLELQITGDATGAQKSLDALIKTLDRLKTATSGGCGLSEVAKGLQQVNNSGKSISTANAKSAKSFANLATKVTAAYLTLKKGGQIVASWIDESNDYIENLNLFTVAMGEYADSAKQYAEEIGEIMGIDPSDWMRSQGVFMTMATGFGVASDRAATLSQQLTQLGYDLSSFYNIDVNEAMTKLRSGLAGELEPLRALGYDLSKAKLAATALSLGIDKTVDSMTQAEKAELRYYAIMTQVTTVQGDMARTLDAPANQLRVLKAQVTQAARALGDLFIPALNAILPVAIAALKVITSLAKIIARLFGADVAKENISDGMGNLANSAGSAGNKIDEATSSAKKLKKTLLGIDELNVMSDTSGSGSGANDYSGGGFDFELPTYDFIGDLTETRVAQIVDDMMEWLGITEDIDSWAELMDTRFGDILKTVGLIGVAIASWKVASWVSLLVNTDWGKLANDAGKLKTVGGSTMSVVGAVMQLMGAWDAWQNGMDWKSLGEQIAGIGAAIGGLAIAVGHIGAGIASIIGGVILTVTSIKDWIENGVDWDNFIGVMVGLAAVFGGISVLVGNWIPMAIGAVVATIMAIVMWWEQISGFFADLWQGIVNLWITVSTWFDTNVIQPVVGFFRGLWESVSGFFVNLWYDIVAVWTTVSTWFDENVIQPVVGFFRGLWETVSGFFSSLWEGIKTVWIAVSTWFDENIIQPLVGLFEGITLRIGQFFEGCWILIQAVWVVASTWFDENVIQPVVGFFRDLWEAVSKFFYDLWEDIKAIWTTVSAWFDENVIQPVVDCFKRMWETVSGFFSDLWEDIKAVWETVSTWFDENVIQPVVDYFEGLWETVSGFFSSLWEGIKTVWANVETWFRDTIIDPLVEAWDKAVAAIGQFFSDLWLGIKRGVANAMNAVIGGIESAINWVVRGINKLIGGFNDIVQWGAKIIGADWDGVTKIKEVYLGRIETYADGGMPRNGQMFIANEAGPEMVGSIGNRTAVANNDQIVESVSRGVYQAVVAAMGQSGGNQVVEAKVNDKVLFEVVVNRNRQETMRTGYSPLLGGV